MGKKDKERAARAHKHQVSLLSLSADPRVSLNDRLAALRRLRPKYFIRALDETLELKLISDESRQKLLDIRDKIKDNTITVKDAVNYLGVNHEPG